MIRPLFGEDELVARFVAACIPGCERGFGPSTAIGWVEDGVLVAGTVYHGYQPEAGAIELSSAGKTPRWLTLPVIRTMFEYPFLGLGCQLVVLRVSERNARMRSIAERFGFTGYRIPRLRGRDEAEIIYTLTVEDFAARWGARLGISMEGGDIGKAIGTEAA